MRKHFESFVNSQPADKAIDHTGIWRNCAIGEYAKENVDDVDFIVATLYTEYGSFEEWDNEGLLPLYGMYDGKVPQRDYRTVMDMLNSMEFNTYGELQQFLLTYPKESV